MWYVLRGSKRWDVDMGRGGWDGMGWMDEMRPDDEMGRAPGATVHIQLALAGHQRLARAGWRMRARCESLAEPQL